MTYHTWLATQGSCLRCIVLCWGCLFTWFLSHNPSVTVTWIQKLHAVWICTSMYVWQWNMWLLELNLCHQALVSCMSCLTSKFNSEHHHCHWLGGGVVFIHICMDIKKISFKNRWSAKIEMIVKWKARHVFSVLKKY